MIGGNVRSIDLRLRGGSRTRVWVTSVVVLLLAWGLRVGALDEVPPGWRDDELINIHALSGEVLRGSFPLYFTGASGHEPLYHYLHAGLHWMLGTNVLSGRLLSAACGTVTIALTFVLTRRLFGEVAGLISASFLVTSFWLLMYSRFGLRHISLPPLALAVVWLLWTSTRRRDHGTGVTTGPLSRFAMLGLVVGVSLYTYPAARLLPALVVAFGMYLALFHRQQFLEQWRGFVLALATIAVVAIPLAVAIARTSGVDARVVELATPVHAALAGNLRPMLEGVWTTLGMFWATGDPEWLYNIPGRPVYNIPGALAFGVGVLLCLRRWRQPRSVMLLLWLGLGLVPAFLSVPPASLSHTILSLPVAYMLPAIALAEVARVAAARRWMGFAVLGVVALVVLSNAVRDIRDYFVVWPQRGIVRFLYRADYRDVARYLNAHPEITDVAVSSYLMGPWDRIALDVDIAREDVAVRIFNPERALVYPCGRSPHVMLPASVRADERVRAMLTRDARPTENEGGPFLVFAGEKGWPGAMPGSLLPSGPVSFENGLALLGYAWQTEKPAAEGEATLLTYWEVAKSLRLPPMPVVANPPPPGVYSGPRVAVFAHVVADGGAPLATDDGLWVDPLTLQEGDRFVQIHHFVLLSDEAPGRYTLELGMYDPMTDARWSTLGASGEPGLDCVSISLQ
jgi:4-amino-4-deoxy-L-arabinose transferase-like glycosyltransferase